MERKYILKKISDLKSKTIFSWAIGNLFVVNRNHSQTKKITDIEKLKNLNNI